MLIFFVVLYALWLTALLVFQERLIFPGAWMTLHDELPLPPGGESLWIETAEGLRVEAWFVPGEGRTPQTPGPLVIFGHGNAERIDSWPWMARAYLEWGVSMLLVEFRGYGRSQGTPSQKGITADFVAYYDLVAQRPEVDAERIFFHGRSVGGGVVVQLASQRKPAAIIVESTFTSLVPMAHRHLAPATLLRHPFRSDRIIETLNVPMLIMHGDHDEIIPFRHGQRLHEMARDSRFVAFDAGHNDFPGDESKYWAKIEAFLREQHLLDATMPK